MLARYQHQYPTKLASFVFNNYFHYEQNALAFSFETFRMLSIVLICSTILAVSARPQYGGGGGEGAEGGGGRLESKLRLKKNIKLINQILDTNAGKQLSYAATDV